MSRLHDGGLESITFGPDGLVPVVVQDRTTGEVLMVAFTTREMLAQRGDFGKLPERHRNPSQLRGKQSSLPCRSGWPDMPHRRSLMLLPNARWPRGCILKTMVGKCGYPSGIVAVGSRNHRRAKARQARRVVCGRIAGPWCRPHRKEGWRRSRRSDHRRQESFARGTFERNGGPLVPHPCASRRRRNVPG